MPSFDQNAICAGISFNLKSGISASDIEEEYDEIETIEFLKVQLASFGFDVHLFEQNEQVFEKLSKVKPAYVLNIAEGCGKGRSRESEMPCILEWLGIPYYGSDAVALGVTLDKYLTNTVLKNAQVPVPHAWVVSLQNDLKALKNTFSKGCFIIKPRWEGSSKGIFNDSVVSSFEACQEKVDLLLTKYTQPALIEEFIDGEEVTIGVFGNEIPQVLGMMRIRERQPSGPFVYSIEKKRSWQDAIIYERADAHLPADIITRIETVVIAAFKALELKDVARIDVRIGRDGMPRVIDVNPLPGLSPRYSDLSILSQLHGLDFSTVVKDIIGISLKRNKIEVVRV